MGRERTGTQPEEARPAPGPAATGIPEKGDILRSAALPFVLGSLLGTGGVAAGRTRAPAPISGVLEDEMPAAERAAGVAAPIAHLGRARASFERRDVPAARRVEPPGRSRLESDAASLRRLADDVEQGAVGSADRIVDAIPPDPPRPGRVLRRGGRRALGRPGGAQAGPALDAAVDEAVTAAGMGTVIGRARWFAARLRSGAARTADEFHQGHEAVETALERLRESFDEQAPSAAVGLVVPIAGDTPPLTSTSR